MAKRGRPKGTKLSKETKQKIADARRGVKHSVITKTKISDTLKEFFQTEQGIKNRKKAQKLGKERMKGQCIKNYKKEN